MTRSTAAARAPRPGLVAPVAALFGRVAAPARREAPRARRATAVASRATALAAGATALAAACVVNLGDAHAQEIFSDGFESGTLCAWSSAQQGFEVPANGEDDDCDGEIDEEAPVCDQVLPSNSSDPAQYAAAMDLCQTTTEEGEDWGLVSASLTLSDGTGSPAAVSHSIRQSFGAIAPQAGSAMAVLSTGTAAAPGQASPAHVAFQTGHDTGTSSTPPADWLAANGGAIPNAPGCPSPSGSEVENPVLLRLRIRVPANARSFRVAANFLSSEYPEWVCSPFNDVFLALLESGYSEEPSNPADENIARYVAADESVHPLGVNLAFEDSGLFAQCLNGDTGCADGAVPGSTSSCAGTLGLTGTGMDVSNPPAVPNQPGWCGASNRAGGGTDWLVLRGNVVPGEIVELRLVLWDTSDGLYDSLVLLDDFRWSTETVEPGATRN